MHTGKCREESLALYASSGRVLKWLRNIVSKVKVLGSGIHTQKTRNIQRHVAHTNRFYFQELLYYQAPCMFKAANS
jgi:hypothetical protein